MSEKMIRDPVHDVIAFRLDRPLDALLFALLNAEEFQRLRRIRQLGMASLAYPGADHSRYSHSLGVMETARKILTENRAKMDEIAKVLLEKESLEREEFLALMRGATLPEGRAAREEEDDDPQPETQPGEPLDAPEPAKRPVIRPRLEPGMA